MRLSIAAKSSQQKAEQVTAERLVNFYAEQTDGVSEIVVHGVPGLTLFCDIGKFPIRGMIDHAGVLYVVTGKALYSIDALGVATEIGEIGGDGRVGMATSGVELVITTSVPTSSGSPCAWLDTYFLFGPGIGQGYTYDGTTLAEIADTDFDTITTNNQWFISNAGDGTAYDALDFASAESNPDDIVRVFAEHTDVLLFGAKTIEPWVNTGNVDFPFEQQSGSITEKGLVSPWAVDKIDNTVFWLDQDGITRRMSDGYGAVRISTHEIEYRMSLGTLGDAEAFAFAWEGHEFFVVNVPGAGSYIYDAATALWHERSSTDENRWRVNTHEKIYDKHMVGDYETGKIYYLDESNYTEDSASLISEMIFPPLNNDGEKFRVHEIQLDIIEGTGSYTDDMTVRLFLSNDGVSWRPKAFASGGLKGERTKRVIWRRLGQHFNLHLKFCISDPYRRAVYAAYLR